jgi:hypothetical protein
VFIQFTDTETKASLKSEMRALESSNNIPTTGFKLFEKPELQMEQA